MPHLTEILATPEAAARKRFRRLDFFTPHPKQLDFIAATKDHNEVMLRAGNQQGKSEAAYMTACHLTGDYPKTWAGRSASPRCGRFRRLIHLRRQRLAHRLGSELGENILQGAYARRQGIAVVGDGAG
jgi:hypothetical protein